MGTYQLVMIGVAIGGIIIQMIRSELNLARWRGTVEGRVANLREEMKKQEAKQGDIFTELKAIREDVHELAKAVASATKDK